MDSITESSVSEPLDWSKRAPIGLDVKWRENNESSEEEKDKASAFVKFLFEAFGDKELPEAIESVNIIRS